MFTLIIAINLYYDTTSSCSSGVRCTIQKMSLVFREAVLSVAGCVDEQTGDTCWSLPVPGGD